MKTLIAVLLTAFAVGVGFFVNPFTVRKVMFGDDYLVLAPEQAKECAEGGGCAIFSQREFQRAVMVLMMQQRKGQL